ncbi:VCBS repeat-containing protein [Streptomyces sp. NBC_01619]|uniref:FG-GAP repeat domain-containing protein n=1 Tax=unclassified Streptomyces TaxID=2593676 RepID=UPI00225BA822|nr:MULTISPECIES: VCBS repeat-containing protein [unclassified Streptomyces]MCX4514963.1 VCBS repeat-containing protein [Streptomyces sp. NBC_01619]
MAPLFGRKRGRALTRIAVAAVATALAVTGTGAASAADRPAPAAAPSSVSAQAPAPSVGAAADPRPAARPNGSRAQAEPGDAPINALYGADRAGDLYGYPPNGTGGLDSRVLVGFDWGVIKHATQADHDADGSSDGVWEINNGGQLFYAPFGGEPASVGGGWNIYNKVLSPGNLAGAAADDLIARDASGVLWIYLGYGNGTLTGRTKVGPGWNMYNQIAGQGDLSGDGRPDIVARDGAGVLWLYRGTGNRTAPFAARTKIGSGWNLFNTLVSVGDIDIDGTTDLIARDAAGALWLYRGTGNAAAPYQARVKIGTSGWNTYRLLF